MATSFNSRLSTAPEEGCKAPCVTVSLTNITLSGEQTIGVTAVVTGDRVLVAGQTDSAENGIWVCNSSSWTRAKDWNTAEDVAPGMLIPVSATEELYQTKPFTGAYNPGVTEITFGVGILSARSVETQTGSQAVSGLFTLTTTTYTPGANNLEVDHNGQRLNITTDYTEPSASTVQIVPARVINADDIFTFRTNSTVSNSVTTTTAITHTRGGVAHNLATYLDGYVMEFDTMAAAIASTKVYEGATLLIKDRANSYWDVVLSSGVTENGYNIVQGVGVGTLSLVLRTDGVAYLPAWGADGTGVTSAVAVIAAASATSGIYKILGKPFDTYLIDSELNLSVANQIFDLNFAKLKMAASWATGDDMVNLTKNDCGIINGFVQGNADITDVVSGIKADFSALGGRSRHRFDNLFVYDFGDSGLRVLSGKSGKTTNITCTNNHIATSSNDSGNVQFSLCNGEQSSNIHVYESYGKGVAWSGSTNCTHNGLIVTRETFDNSGDTGIFTDVCDNIKITNVVTKNVSNKLSQFSDNVQISNFTLENAGYRPLQLQGAANCKLTSGKVICTATTSDSFACYMDRHPDAGSGTSDADFNEFRGVRFESAYEVPLSLDGNTNGNKFIGCEYVSNAADVSGSANDYLVVDFGTNNQFINAELSVSTSANYGGIYHTGAGWVEKDCTINVPAITVRAAAAGKIRGGEYTSTGGTSNAIAAQAAIDMKFATVLVDGSTAAVAGVNLSAAGTMIHHCDIRCITDSVAGYGVNFGGGASVENIEICHSTCYGGVDGLFGIIQSTTNVIKYVNTLGSGTSNGVNGTTAPGAHVSFSVD